MSVRGGIVVGLECLGRGLKEREVKKRRRDFIPQK